MKMAYVGHPFQGKIENVEDVERLILELLKIYPDTVFFSPLLEMSYEAGMEHCFEALSRCDELWLCDGWETSKGCNLEVGYAEELGMPIKYIKNDYSLEVHNG